MAYWGQQNLKSHMKTTRTSQEEHLKGRQPHKKITLQEDRKKALQKEDITGM